MKTSEVRTKTDAELRFDLDERRRELFDLRFRSSTEQSANPSRIREARREVARIRTVLHERANGIRGQEAR